MTIAAFDTMPLDKSPLKLSVSTHNLAIGFAVL